MTSQTVMNTAIYTKLSGTALTSLLSGGTASPSVFFGQAPDNFTLPYVVFLYPVEADENLIPHRMKNIVIRAYGVAAAPAQAGTIDAAIDTLLNGATLTVSGWTNIWLHRENGYQVISTSESGIRYYTSGADYRAEITKG
jgi:hypothetical protein